MPRIGRPPRRRRRAETSRQRPDGPSGPGFARALLRWYGKHRRDLPWRRTSDPYAIWISEVMLQQTTVGAVIPYYRRWIEVFPGVRALAAAPLRRVLKTWQGLGYYARARNLRTAARIVVAEHGGRLPRDPAVLRRLPGFGPYTTAAVLSLAFDKPLPVIDANVRRLFMRLAAIPGRAEPGRDAALMKRIRAVFPPRKAGDFNQAMMELGALVCRPKSPQCLACPVSAFCRAFAKGEQEIIPRPKKRVERRIEAVVAVIERNGKYLIQKRPSRGLLADLWEFPGGKVEPGETREEALAREVREELGTEVVEAAPLAAVRHAYTEFRITLHAFACRVAGEIESVPGRRRWASFREIGRLPVPSGTARLLERIRAGS